LIADFGRLCRAKLIKNKLIILQDLSGNGNGDKSQTAFDLLQNMQTERVFSTAEEVDEHLQAERESWDN
jgi:hypothetical protein